MIALFREISFRHWVRSPLRSLLVVLGIALCVALYIATTRDTGVPSSDLGAQRAP